MSKLIPMEQAATMLGMSVEQINELRSNQEIFGYKDGGTWKFKMTELERVAGNLGISLGGAGDVLGALGGKAKNVADSFDDLDFGDSEELLLDDDSSSSMEIDIDEDSSVELMQSGRSSDIFIDFDDEPEGVTLEDSGLLLAGSDKDMGTSKDGELVLGGSDIKLEDSGSLKLGDDSFNLDDDSMKLVGDDSVKLASDDSVKLGDSGSLKLQGESALDIAADTSKDGAGSKLNLGDSGVLELGTGSEVLEDDQLSFGTSDISLASGSKVLKAGDTGSDILAGEEAPSSGSPSTGKLVAGDDDDLLLGEESLFEDDLVLQDSSSFDDSSDLGSDFSDDLVLDDSDSSSELALEANESGISLSANESGISLADEPLELGGSDIDELELPGDDMIMLDDEADPEMATMMQEDDFNLTPLEQSADGIDGDGSSSQVIMLEDSEIFADESEATILGGDAFGEPALVEDESYAGAGLVGGAALIGGAGAAMAPGMMTDESVAYAGPAAVPQADYSIGSLLGLGLAASVLLLGAILAFDTCRNLWMNDSQVVNSGFLDMIITAFGMKN